jgi:exosortase family protein XrtM
LLLTAFEASRGSAFERFMIETCTLAPTVQLIDVIRPDERVRLVGRTLSSPGSNLRVTRGCEGVELLLMLVAGVLAYPASTAWRAKGLILGGALCYGLSVARLLTLHFILRYSPSAWQTLHGLILPLAPIVLIGLYFMGWSARARHRVFIGPSPDAA